MIIEPAALSVTDSVEILADWVEIHAFRDRDGNGSHMDLMKALRMSGTADALDENEGSGFPMEGYEGAVESAFTEIEDRFRACGAEYPFDMETDYIAMAKSTRSSVYTFLLLLSCFGDRAGSKLAEGAKLFEEVCAK